MKLFVTPSRWGSLVAGCPKVPSLFSAKNPEVWAVNRDGSPDISAFGPFASVHHPATFEFFAGSLEKLFSIAPVEGIIWDEVKGLSSRDYSPAAQKALQDKNIDDVNVHIDAKAAFFERVNAEALKFRPDCMMSMFVFGHLKGYTVERLAAISNLNCFGLDGRPYRSEDGGGNDSGKTAAHKLLLDHAPLFIETAHANGKWAFMLIENHAMSSRDIDIMEQRLPEVLELDVEHVCYYYYPRSVSEADRAMNVLKKELRNVKRN
jgi:hypothetical protein